MKDDPDFNIYFVSLIEKQRHLYDYTCADYSNKNAQDRAWENIAIEVSESVPDCKERWKNLRACYSRHLKSITIPSGPGSRYKKPYYLAEFLTFLDPFTKSRKKRSGNNISLELSYWQIEENNRTKSPLELLELSEEDEKSDTTQSPDEKPGSTNENQQNSTIFSAPSVKKFRKYSQYDDTLDRSPYEFYNSRRKTERVEFDSESPDLSFLKSILYDMAEMNSEQKRSFKIGILTLAQKILGERNTIPPSD